MMKLTDMCNFYPWYAYGVSGYSLAPDLHLIMVCSAFSGSGPHTGLRDVPCGIHVDPVHHLWLVVHQHGVVHGTHFPCTPTNPACKIGRDWEG